jgi:hypothetical protein
LRREPGRHNVSPAGESRGSARGARGFDPAAGPEDLLARPARSHRVVGPAPSSPRGHSPGFAHTIRVEGEQQSGRDE